MELLAQCLQVHLLQQLLHGLSAHAGVEIVLVLFAHIPVFLLGEDLIAHQRGLAGIGDDISGEIQHLFQDAGADVQQQIETDSRAFAEKIVKVFNDEDLETMKDMVLYPQETSGGQSIANENELLNVDKKALFTDILMKALNDENALENLRKTNDGSEYVIGTNYKNVHFRLNDDGQFVITKINN